MDISIHRMKKIKIDRGDALGGALPLVVMKSKNMAEMKSGPNRRVRRMRRKRAGSWQNYVTIFLIVGIVAGLIAALLGEGPRF